MQKRTGARRSREPRGWDRETRKLVDRELNALSNKYHAEEVGDRDGNTFLFVQSGDRGKRGCRYGRYGTRHIESASTRQRESRGRTKHSNKRYTQHQKSSTKEGDVESENINDRVRISGGR